MERQEIGRFYATTFNGITFEFIVFNNNTIDCPALNLRSFSRIDLKPRFVLSQYQISLQNHLSNWIKYLLNLFLLYQ